MDKNVTQVPAKNFGQNTDLLVKEIPPESMYLSLMDYIAFIADMNVNL